MHACKYFNTFCSRARSSNRNDDLGYHLSADPNRYRATFTLSCPPKLNEMRPSPKQQWQYTYAHRKRMQRQKELGLPVQGLLSSSTNTSCNSGGDGDKNQSSHTTENDSGSSGDSGGTKSGGADGSSNSVSRASSVYVDGVGGRKGRQQLSEKKSSKALETTQETSEISILSRSLRSCSTIIGLRFLSLGCVRIARPSLTFLAVMLDLGTYVLHACMHAYMHTTTRMVRTHIHWWTHKYIGI